MSRPVYVQESGVLLPSGDSASALLCATVAGVSAVNVVKELAVAVGSDNRAHLPRMACFSDEVEWEDNLALILEGLLAVGQPVLLIAPDKNAPQSRWIQEVLAQSNLAERVEQISAEGLGKMLSLQVRRLRAGEISGVSVLGVDRQVHPVNVMQQAADAKLQTDKLPDGRAAGEGFAWFTLGSEPAAVQWLSEAAGAEPNAQAGVPVSLQGLADTLSALSLEEELRRPRLIIHARAQTPQDDLEWHRASQRLWPNRLAPRDNLAMRKGQKAGPQPPSPPWQQHLKPAHAVGELGAAALPMAIALACERLCWSLTPAHEALVVDAGNHTHRSAVWLRNTESQGCDRNE